MGKAEASKRMLACFFLLNIFAILPLAASALNPHSRQAATGDILDEQTIRLEIAGQEQYSSLVEMKAGQVLRVRVKSRSAKLSVTLAPPGGPSLDGCGCDLPAFRHVSSISRKGGRYQLTLRLAHAPSKKVPLEIRLQRWRSATPQLMLLLEAEESCRQAEALKEGTSPESDRMAVLHYQQARRAWRSAGAADREAATLRAMGQAYMRLGDSQAALESYRFALSLDRDSGNRRGEIESINSLVPLLIQLGENQQAEQSGRRALRLSRQQQDLPGQAWANENMGEVQYHLGNRKSALTYYQSAQSIWQGLGSIAGQARAWLSLGYAYSDLNEAERAFEAYDKALDHWALLKDEHGEARTRTGIGHLCAKLGQKQEALHQYRQAAPVLRRLGDWRSEGAVLAGKGFVYLELGQPERALDFHQQALQKYRDSEFRVGQAGALMKIGECHFAMDQVLKAIQSFQAALQVFREIADRKMESAALRLIGEAHALLGNDSDALAHFQLALDSNQVASDSREEAYILNGIGRVRERQKRFGPAMDHYERAGRLNRKARDPLGEALTLYNIARLERNRGDLAKARRHLESALRLTESLRGQVALPTLRSSYFSSVHDYYELYIEVLMGLHLQSPSEGLAEMALQVNERAKAQSLLERLGESSVDIQSGVSPQRRQTERRLIEQINARALRLTLNQQPTASADALRAEIRRLQYQLSDLRAAVRLESPAYAAIVQPQILSLNEIQELLDPETLFLEFSLADTASFLWAITSEEWSSYRLPPRSEVEQAVLRLRESLTARLRVVGDDPRAYRSRVRQAEAEYWIEAQSLSRQLLGLEGKLPRRKRILIAPDGALHYLPFAALPSPWRLAEEGSPSPLALDHEIAVVPSASALAALQNRPNRTKSDREIAVFADPVFERDDIRTVQPVDENPSPLPEILPELRSAFHRNAGTDGQGIPRLPSTRREAQAVFSLVPEGMRIGRYLDFAASRQAATSPEIGLYRILHFATHGFFSEQHPSLSGIILSLVDQRGNPQNGSVLLHDIYNLTLSAELVVLSACSTGMGKNVEGEGLIGLVRAFMYAGAPRVVASLWRVDDQATRELMEFFYTEIYQKGRSPAAALRLAQTSMLKHPQQRFRSPFYWAPFVLYGRIE